MLEPLLDWGMPVEALITHAIHRLGEGLQFLCIVGTQVGECVLGDPRLGRQFIQTGEGRTCRHLMCQRVFPFEGAVPFETEQPDDGRQAQSLPD